MHKITVLSLGGSIIAPAGGIDVEFVKKFIKFVKSEITTGRRFIIVVGGGQTARSYQQAAASAGKLASEDVDWLGIHATRLNAHLLRTVFRDQAQAVVVKDPTRSVKWNKPLLFAAGWKPGWSTDYIAARLAVRYDAKTVINLSNISVAYDKDPKKFADAKPLKSATWKEFRKIVGDKWIPGMNAPFDPIASKFAEKKKLEVVIANGRDLKNLKKILEGGKFVGTRVS